jgi:hypothetical protein
VAVEETAVVHIHFGLVEQPHFIGFVLRQHNLVSSLCTSNTDLGHETDLLDQDVALRLQHGHTLLKGYNHPIQHSV